MNDYRIRLATENDVRPALEMKLQSWREAYAALREPSFFDHHERELEGQVAWWERGLASGAQFFIAEDAQGKIIGLAGGTPTIEEDQDAGVEIELGMLYVASQYYGSGLGAHLMELVLGQREALVWVIEGNDRALAFFEKHGFKADGTTEALVGTWQGLNERRMVRVNG
ncbi:GNAT family N-acetyltransferase [Glutamicibacter sp. JC586]|uniref:GNAT family N-acetyltransferase n=1 Tax=Glutamicibacter sp. JC586 TaxID=2590552 RepID=UPI001F27C230|nr:GNAT family N-acetyltransferase [Glutamicibacter sp. JC586]